MAEQDQQPNNSPEEVKQSGRGQLANNCFADGFEEVEAVAGEESSPSGNKGFAAGWEQEKQELVEQLQRERANFDNFRRISRQQQESAREYALFDFCKKLLPVLDDLERAIFSACQEKAAFSYVQGLEMIYNQLVKLLSQEGVCQIETEGQCFDPNFHHAVAQVENTGGAKTGEPGTVAEELTRGYTFKDRILRPSMVKVYK